MTKRVTAFLAAIGTAFLLTAYAQRLRSPQQLAVYDADGKKVGVVTGAEHVYGAFLPAVPFKVDQVPLFLQVFRDGFVGQSVVAWESTDCSGTPFLTVGAPGDFRPPSALPLVGVGLPGNTVYVEDGPPRTINVRSYSTFPLQGPPPWPPHRCVLPGITPWTRVSVPARPLIDMNTEFRPPFTVR